jgi:histidinol-phosphate aminotransferase
VQNALLQTHRYPDATAFKLKTALAAFHKKDLSEFTIGNGSNEIIELMIHTYAKPGDKLVTSQGAFIAYRVSGQAHGLEIVQTPMLPGYRFDLSAMAREVCSDDRVKLVFIANPNNPTGTYNTGDELRGFLKEVTKKRGDSVLIGLDDAYAEYVTAADLPNAFEILSEFTANVVVLRTFSKIYGLAGFRVGYGVARPEIIQYLNKVKMPFNVSSLGLIAAEAGLSDTGFVKKSQAVNVDGMGFVTRELSRLGIPFAPSQGNFLMLDARHGFEMSGGQVFEACLKEGIILRPLGGFGLEDHVRMSIGTMEECRRAIAAFSKIKAP